jgi:hypothetical protein
VRLSPPEPYAEWSGTFFCSECDADTDQDCVQWIRGGPFEGYCLECSHENTHEFEEPDVP